MLDIPVGIKPGLRRAGVAPVYSANYKPQESRFLPKSPISQLSWQIHLWESPSCRLRLPTRTFPRPFVFLDVQQDFNVTDMLICSYLLKESSEQVSSNQLR